MCRLSNAEGGVVLAPPALPPGPGRPLPLLGQGGGSIEGGARGQLPPSPKLHHIYIYFLFLYLYIYPIADADSATVLGGAL